MKCSVCGKDNASDTLFCEGCGRKIPRCPTCGVELTNRDRFCSNDGTRLSDDLLLLVPEEAFLQEPVWTAPQAAPAVTAAAPSGYWGEPGPDALSEATVMAGSAPKAAPAAAPQTIYETMDSGETELLSPAASPFAPPVRNMDPVSTAPWSQAAVQAETPKRAFCENCGRPCTPGNRFCPECRAARAAPAVYASELPKKKKSGKWIGILILILLLLAGLAAGGYALLNSDLFDWDTSSSNRSNRAEKDEDEDEDLAEDEIPISGGDVTVEDTAPVDGVVDPVVTEAPTESTAPQTEPETTEAPTEEEDPLLYFIKNCDKMYMTEADLAGFDAEMCRYARNACYAKAGRMFSSADLQAYFSQFDWYRPTISASSFSDSMLNDYERANVQLVSNYEKAHGYK